MRAPLGGFYLGHLLGIPVYIHPSALMLVFLAYLIGGDLRNMMAVLIVVVTGLIAHEFGHGLMAGRFGATDLSVTLMATGGICASARHKQPAREMLILAAGPTVSYLLSGLGFLLLWILIHVAPRSLVASETGTPTSILPILFPPNGDFALLSPLGLLLSFWCVLNLVWAIFNCLPIYPLDGGQFLHNLLQLPFRETTANRITLLVTIGIAAAFIGLMALTDSLNLWNVILVFILLQIAFTHLNR